jgi:Flp pilus assembly protein TadD
LFRRFNATARFFLALAVVGSFVTALQAQQQILGSIIGHIRVVRGDVPSERLMVTLENRGATVDSVYTDGEGQFGFHNLPPNAYYININDDQYQPVRLLAVIEATTQNPMVLLDVVLVPKTNAKPGANAPAPGSGANPNMVDVRQFSEHYPKPAVKEFKKGLGADREGKIDDAIRHYQKAVTLAPEFYQARNNLGSDQLKKGDSAAARTSFEQVIQLNQSDAAGYFNLSNVDMLAGNLGSAQKMLDEGLRRQPDSALGKFLLGTLDLRLGKLPAAEQALRQAMQLDPVMVQPRLQLVNLLLQQGRKQDAANELHAFLDAFPNDPRRVQARDLLLKLESGSPTLSPPK